jgi:hypothetical protein
VVSRARCIVPLAGPDMVHPALGPRALIEVEGEPLVRRALGTRAWRGALAPQDHVFVLRDAPGAGEIETYLRATWPGAGIVRIPWVTGGAMLSALAAVAMVPVDGGPIVVDLADILFDGGPAPDALSGWSEDLGGIVPYFSSSDPKYSYLEMEGDRVLSTAEKRVISNAASAGVYVFRDPETYIAAAAHSARHRRTLAHKGALFVCPMFNGVAALGLTVLGVEVSNVRPIGAMFHAS